MGYSFYLTNFSFRTVANAFLRSGDLVNLVSNVPEVCSHRCGNCTFNPGDNFNSVIGKILHGSGAAVAGQNHVNFFADGKYHGLHANRAFVVGPGVGYRLELHGLRINDNKVRRETKTLPDRSVCSRTIG